jgi:hypothetical protein
MPQAATVPHGNQPSLFAAASPSKQITCCARGRQAHRFRTELQKRLSVAAISGGSLSLWKLLRDRRRRIQPLRLRALSRLLPCGRAPGRSSVVENHRRPADPAGLDAIRFPEDHVSHQGKGHSFRCNRHHHQGTKDRCHPPRRRVAHDRRWDWRTDSREPEPAMKDHRDCPVADSKRRSILGWVRTLPPRQLDCYFLAVRSAGSRASVAKPVAASRINRAGMEPVSCRLFMDSAAQ